MGRSGIMDLPSAWASLGERHKNGSQTSRPAAATEDMFSACDKTRARLARHERIPDHTGRRDRRRHVEAPDFEEDKVGEVSTIQDRCVLLKQNRSSPGEAPRGPAGPPAGGRRTPEGGLHLRRRCGVPTVLAARSAGNRP